MRVSWQVKCQLIGAFSLVFDNQWIHCHYLLQIEIYLDHQYSESSSNRNLTLHWWQNSCPGIALILLNFRYWAIWRVVTCSTLTLRRCFINTLHDIYFPSSQKHYQTPVHKVAYGHPFSFTFKSPALHQYASVSSLSKSSRFLILRFLMKCSKLHSVFKILSKSHMLDIFFNFTCVLQMFI